MNQSFLQDQDDNQFDYEVRANASIFKNRSILIGFDEKLKEEIIFNDVFMGFEPQPDPQMPLELPESCANIFMNFVDIHNIPSQLPESPISPFIPHVNSTTLEADISSSDDYASNSSFKSFPVCSVPNGLNKWLSFMMKEQSKSPKIVEPCTSNASDSSKPVSKHIYCSKKRTWSKVFSCCCAEMSCSSESEHEHSSPAKLSASWCPQYLVKSNESIANSTDFIQECTGTTTVPNNSSSVSWFENNRWSSELKFNPNQANDQQSTTTQEPFTTPSTIPTKSSPTVETLELLYYPPNQCCSQYRRCEYLGKNLLRCCEEDDYETADFLIKAAHFCRGVLNFRQPGTKDTPLHIAIRCKSLNVFHLLMQYHETLNFGALNADEATPLCLACSIPDIPLAIVGRLIPHSKTFITIPDHFLSCDPYQYMTPLRYAQAYNRTDIENLLFGYLQKHQNDKQKLDVKCKLINNCTI